MSAVPIVSCGQCPNYGTLVPISPAQLPRSDARIAQPGSNALVTNTILQSTYPVNPSYIGPNDSGRIEPPRISMKDIPNGSLSEYENSWRSKFLRLPVLIHEIVEIVLTSLILILEIASLGISTYEGTGAGIWCGIPFMTVSILTIMLVLRWDRSIFWATRVFMAQLVLIVFTLILIGIVGNFVSTNAAVVSLYSSSSVGTTNYGNNFSTKYQIMQAQLAFAILLLFSELAYVIFYCVVTYLALWKPFQTLDTAHLFRP